MTVRTKVPLSEVVTTAVWSTDDAGDRAVQLELVAPGASECAVMLRARGVARSHGPVAGLHVEGRPYLSYSGRSSLLEPTRVRAHLDHHEVDPEPDREELWAYALHQGLSRTNRFDFERPFNVTFAVRNASVEGGELREADEAPMGNATVRVDVTCDRAVEVRRERLVRDVVLFTEVESSRGVGAHAGRGITLLHAGVGEGLVLEASGPVLATGTIGGDPEKVSRIVLDAPSETHYWYALPTAYVGGPGDLGWEFTDRAGRYRLTIDSASSVFAIEGAFFVTD